MGSAQQHGLGRGVQDGPAPEQGAGDRHPGPGRGQSCAVRSGLPQAGGLL